MVDRKSAHDVINGGLARTSIGLNINLSVACEDCCLRRSLLAILVN